MARLETRIELLTARLHRSIAQCDQLTQRIELVEERLTNLNLSVRSLDRLIEISLFVVSLSTKAKLRWIQLLKSNSLALTHPFVQHFFDHFQLHLKRSIHHRTEQEAYIQALSSLYTI